MSKRVLGLISHRCLPEIASQLGGSIHHYQCYENLIKSRRFVLFILKSSCDFLSTSVGLIASIMFTPLGCSTLLMKYREYRACFNLETAGLLVSLIWMNLRSHAVYFSLAPCLLHDSLLVATDAVGHLTEFALATVTSNVMIAGCLCSLTE